MLFTFLWLFLTVISVYNITWVSKKHWDPTQLKVGNAKLICNLMGQKFVITLTKVGQFQKELVKVESDANKHGN